MKRLCHQILAPYSYSFVVILFFCYGCFHRYHNHPSSSIFVVDAFSSSSSLTQSYYHYSLLPPRTVKFGRGTRRLTQQRQQKQQRQFFASGGRQQQPTITTNNNHNHHHHNHRSSSLSSSSSSSLFCSTSSDSDNNENNINDDQLLKKILDVAIVASKKAGNIIKENSDGVDTLEKKSTNRDLLTIVDPLCEKAIREIVLENFPDHQFLGEEQVEPGIDAAIKALEEKIDIGGWLWIVDPIDGTTNFASGIPINIPSIAVAYNGEVQVGVLFDPHRDELFTAIRGKGAYLNGQQRIYVGSESTLGDAVIGMESPAGQESLQQCLQAIPHLMPQCRTIRMLGSSAVMLPWVANGRLTAYWTPDECAWDVAAGALILQEAGGRVTDFDNNNFTLRTRDLVGSNGEVHDALLHVLVEEAKLVGLVRGER